MKQGGATPGTCALCLTDGPLCQSHALPHALFKEIHRRNNGSAIAISSGGEILHKTSDSGKAYLLCRSCENRLNLDFDAPAINALKQARAQQFPRPGTTIKVSSDVLGWFMLSVAWRAVVSGARVYADLRMPAGMSEALRSMIWLRGDSPHDVASYFISDLYDSHGTFTRTALNDFVVVPAKVPEKAVIEFIAAGFLFSVDFRPMSQSRRKKASAMRPNVTIVRAPPQDVRCHRGFMTVVMSGQRKIRRGHSTFI